MRILKESVTIRPEKAVGRPEEKIMTHLSVARGVRRNSAEMPRGGVSVVGNGDIVSPQHPNCWGGLLLRAAIDYETMAVVYYQANERDGGLLSTWARYRLATSGEASDLLGLLDSDALVTIPGPGCYLLFHSSKGDSS